MNETNLKQFLTFYVENIEHLTTETFYPLHHTLFMLSLQGMGVLPSLPAAEKSEELLIKNLAGFNKELVIIDIGANVGNYSAVVRQLHPTALLYAFEPNPAAYAQLKEKAQQHNFHAANIGFSNTITKMTLYDDENNQGSEHASLYQNVMTNLHNYKEVKQHVVKLVTLDSFLENKSIATVDLLKIDTEGHELSILQGATDTLARRRIDMIHFEFNEMNIVSKVFFKDFYDLLTGFDFYRMLPTGLLPLHYKENHPVLCEIFGFQNILAVRRNSFWSKNLPLFHKT